MSSSDEHSTLSSAHDGLVRILELQAVSDDGQGEPALPLERSPGSSRACACPSTPPASISGFHEFRSKRAAHTSTAKNDEAREAEHDQEDSFALGHITMTILDVEILDMEGPARRHLWSSPAPGAGNRNSPPDR